MTLQDLFELRAIVRRTGAIGVPDRVSREPGWMSSSLELELAGNAPNLAGWNTTCSSGG